MSKITNGIKSYMLLFGFNWDVMVNSFKGLPFYFNDLKTIKKQMGKDNSFPLGRKKMMLIDRFAESGTMKGHYFHQDLFVAQKVFESNPVNHVDIGSRTDGFVAHVASFREIEVFDIRDQKSLVKNIVCKQADLMQLPKGLEAYCDSISALHSIEHFGLGRYGDPMDFYGHLKAIENITKMLKSGGKFYFSVPIGWQRIEFNAHRIFSVARLLELFDKDFDLDSFSYVDDKGDFYPEVEITKTDAERSFGCNYGCGIFVLTKK